MPARAPVKVAKGLGLLSRYAKPAGEAKKAKGKRKG
jgi:hypothetical protein